VRSMRVLLLIQSILLTPSLAMGQVCQGDVGCVVLYSEAGHTPATNGAELVYQAGGMIQSNLRSAIAAGDAPDINAAGEVVYRGTDAGGVSQTFSTTRGQLTAVADENGADGAAVNSLGEVVFTARDAGNNTQLYSTARGQLTFDPGFGISQSENAIDDSGRAGSSRFRRWTGARSSGRAACLRGVKACAGRWKTGS
jgi:hypothetical protein